MRAAKLNVGESRNGPVYEKLLIQQIGRIANFIFAQILPVVNLPAFRIIDVLLADQGGGISKVTGVLDHGRSHNAISGIANLFIDAVVNRFTDRLWLLSEG